MKSKRNDRGGRLTIYALAAVLIPFSVLACGPFFPNSMLDRGDEAVLAAPKVDFFAELERLKLPHPAFAAHNVDNHAQEAGDADRIELAAALGERGITGARKDEIISSFEKQRTKLTILRGNLEEWNPAGSDEWTNGQFVHHDPPLRPFLADFAAENLSGAPEEFVQYLQGSVAWFNGQTNQAREAWEAILHHAKEKRHYRSTWAAFMLGKSWAGEDPEKAAAYFQQVRKLKTEGFADKIGLAAASLGEEARIRRRQTNVVEAMDLYIQQLGTGDATANSSLRFICHDGLTNDSGTLTRLAADTTKRRVMTAYIAADGDADDENFEENRLRWLKAVEAANISDVDSAEELALAAYQAGEWGIAQRWLNHASDTPTAQWLRAKLLLRDGKIDDAAKILANIVELFPESDPHGTNDVAPSGLQDTLEIGGSTYAKDFVSLRAQAQAESGALHLTRREYTESLDAFLRAGFWKDAAYVAERVLSLGELKEYVDQNWPASVNPTNAPANDSAFAVHMNNEIRYLLGRRLARARQWRMARPYYPRDQWTNYDALANAIDTAKNPETSKDDRIYALLEASSLVRSNGMELLGYELEPDWAICPSYGGFVDFMTKNRSDTNNQIIRASDDEMERAQHGLDSRRFHYRYEAAELAMVAAKLMPDNTDEKAVVLCTAGSWLKYIDGPEADVYYKALVRHCRKTAIGALADKMRWFPELDAEGNPVPWKPEPPVEIAAPADAPSEGIWYWLKRGDDLQDVADAAANEHQRTITVAEIQEANPTVNINRLKAGLKIFVPAQAPPGKSE